jgi:hypothetical protein
MTKASCSTISTGTKSARSGQVSLTMTNATVGKWRGGNESFEKTYGANRYLQDVPRECVGDAR